MKFGIINGSVRESSNTAAFISSLQNALAQQQQQQQQHQQNGSYSKDEVLADAQVEFDFIHLTSSPGHPLPLIISNTIPAAHPFTSLPSAYSDPLISAWSARVLSWSAVLIITPQYNWGIPSVLKNALDHLYHEWTGKDAGIVTLGGHGGGKCAAQLREVMGGGLKMNVLEDGVQVTLGKEVIRTEKRLDGSEEDIREKVEEVVRLVQKLVVAARSRSTAV